MHASTETCRQDISVTTNLVFYVVTPPLFWSGGHRFSSLHAQEVCYLACYLVHTWYTLYVMQGMTMVLKFWFVEVFVAAIGWYRACSKGVGGRSLPPAARRPSEVRVA